MLPTGKVMTFSGATADEVVAPGTGASRSGRLNSSIPKRGSGRAMATAHEGRTYHNTAILLPSGQILVGGHAPISTLDTFNFTIPGGFTEQLPQPDVRNLQPALHVLGPAADDQLGVLELRARREREGRDTAGERNRLGGAGAQHSAHAPRRRRPAQRRTPDHLAHEQRQLEGRASRAPPRCSRPVPTCCSSTGARRKACNRAPATSSPSTSAPVGRRASLPRECVRRQDAIIAAVRAPGSCHRPRP